MVDWRDDSAPPPENRWLRPVWCTVVGMAGNLVLTGAKLAVGFAFRSTALVADGVHSFTDLVSDLAVLFALRASSRPPDEDHPYGHHSFESLGAIAVSGLMILIGLAIGRDAVLRLWRGENLTPGMPALAMALISVLVKEAMARYTLVAARRSHSPALLTNGIMHRTDALTSLAAGAGILGAVAGIHWLDSAGALVISVFILNEGWRLTHRNVMALMDTMPDADFVATLREAAVGVEGVIELRDLRVRQRGSIFLADLRVAVAPESTVCEAHRVAHDIESALKASAPELGRVFVHVEPAESAGRVNDAAGGPPSPR